MEPPEGDIIVKDKEGGTTSRADVADFCIKAVIDDDCR